MINYDRLRDNFRRLIEAMPSDTFYMVELPNKNLVEVTQAIIEDWAHFSRAGLYHDSMWIDRMRMANQIWERLKKGDKGENHIF